MRTDPVLRRYSVVLHGFRIKSVQRSEDLRRCASIQAGKGGQRSFETCAVEQAHHRAHVAIALQKKTAR
jgi:hypothetical protein